ncbi:AMP-dependent synthetase/ligase [Nitriliruptor alkaliphilus]|uniref:AMP-dependent synthetase/ligase n=1 Tax=Nitriliruptor alkaliphilus TaxID=427918 RepID=UPI000697107B|nr:long-chain fatty acid--CoA ligase [Nitriliruptor alkaliphilus]
MREYTSPGPASVGPGENLTTALWETRRSSPARAAVAVRDGDRFEEWSVERFCDEVSAAGRGLIGLGIEPGQRIAVYAATRVEWTILDYSIWAAGAVTVPIYDTSSAEQVEWIVSDSGAVAIFIGSAEQHREYEQVADRLDDVAHAFVLDDGGLEELKRAGRDVSDDQLQERAAAVTGEDLATIVYTSGTTGNPKGCLLTHHNFVWTVEQTRQSLERILQPGRTTLLFLPLAHIFSRVIQVVCLRTGVVLGFSTGLEHLKEELALFSPSFLLAVPRVFEKVLNGAQQKAHDEGKGAIFDRAAEVAADLSQQRAAGSVGLWTRIQHAVFDKLVYGKLRDAMGGEVEYAVSGGAALGTRIAHFFDGIGVTVLEGYGLTETTAPVAVNRPDAHRIGTVGQPLPGVTVRIADDGEIVVRGDNVFQGYHQNRDATEEVLDEDGWFRTEDLGELDDDGFLTITGRAKELIVTASGKNVAPAVIEDRLRAHPLVSQSMVVGDGKPFIGALIALDPDEVPRWAEEHHKDTSDLADLAEDEELAAELQRAVDEANEAVSRAERVREFRILPEDLTVEEGELTPTLKVKRGVVEERYADLIDDIYAGAGSDRG